MQITESRSHFFPRRIDLFLFPAFVLMAHISYAVMERREESGLRSLGEYHQLFSHNLMEMKIL